MINKLKLLDSLVAEVRVTALVICTINKLKLLDSIVAEVTDFVKYIQTFYPPPQ